MLEVRDVCKKFEDTVAVESIGFEVKENEIFGLIGADSAKKPSIDLVVLVKMLLAGYLINIRLEKRLAEEILKTAVGCGIVSKDGILADSIKADASIGSMIETLALTGTVLEKA